VCISEAVDLRLMVLEALGINPFLVIKSDPDSNGVLRYFQVALLLFRDGFTFSVFNPISWFFLLVFFLFSFSFEHPGKWGHSAADSTVLAIPVGCNFTDSFLTVSLKLDALDRGIVKAASTDNEVSATFNRSEVRLNFLNFDIVISERDGSAGELLPIKSHVHVVTHVVSLEGI
jgi:hypothetical protein